MPQTSIFDRWNFIWKWSVTTLQKEKASFSTKRTDSSLDDCIYRLTATTTLTCYGLYKSPHNSNTGDHWCSLIVGLYMLSQNAENKMKDGTTWAIVMKLTDLLIHLNIYLVRIWKQWWRVGVLQANLHFLAVKQHTRHLGYGFLCCFFSFKMHKTVSLGAVFSQSNLHKQTKIIFCQS